MDNKNNNQINWVNFLHFYQPPSIDKETILEVCKNSYDFILKVLEESKNGKATINVNASLLELLDKNNKKNIIDKIKYLYDNNKIELVLSAAYHPILPLIPFREALRQIQKSIEIIEKYFDNIKIKGFFFPEMIYSKKIAKYLKSIGIEWIILDEIVFNGKFNQIDYSQKYIDKNSNLIIIFRNRKYSNTYPPKKVLELSKENKNVKFFISGTDAELYGDRHIDFEGDFYNSFRNEKIKPIFVKEYLKKIDNNLSKEINPIKASWDSDEELIKKKQALDLWKNPKNKIHNYLWSLTEYALKIVRKNKKDPNYYWARWRLDRGLASCTYWWASGKKISSWNNLIWHPDQIEIGAKDLVRSIRSLKNISISQRLEAEKKYLKIINLIWKTHWKHFYKK